MSYERSPLETVRERIDAIDSELLQLLDERAVLAQQVAAAKQAEPPSGKVGIRAAREAQVIRRLLKAPRQTVSAGLVVRVWRELIGESLRIQGPYRVTVWGGRNPGRAVELARLRFGAAPQLTLVQQPEAALAATRSPGGVAVLAIEPGDRWWGRLLAEPRLNVFATLPCLTSWGAPGALAVAETPVEPSGLDETYWVTDAPGSGGEIEAALGREGVAGYMLAEAGGLKLFGLPGYFQRDDERLARAPGRLTGVIGAAPAPFDL